MILRLGANAAVHAIGGVAMGVTLALAACTLARATQRGTGELGRSGAARPSSQPPSESSGSPADPAGG